MNERDDKIRQVMAELDAHVAEVEANVAALKALLASKEFPEEDEVSEEEEDPS